MAEAVPMMNAQQAPDTHKRVLIIDDSPMIVELIRSVVTMNGSYDALVAYDGVSGLEMFYKERPDCVIVDVKMPRMDGYQVVRCIRGDTTSAQTPLIILSAMNEEADHLAGWLSGVDEYLAKPFKPSALCATLERVMNITPEERTHRIEHLASADFDDELVGVEDVDVVDTGTVDDGDDDDGESR
jgi:two-component system alkaline phosphatase synthesis response regulator PhoP